MAEFGSLAPDVGMGEQPIDPVLAALRARLANRNLSMVTPVNPAAQGAFNAGSVVAPNAMSILAGQPDPRQFSNQPLPEYGKVPPTDDPRNDRALSEILGLGAAMVPAGRAAMGIEGAARLLPEAMQGAPGMASPIAAAGAPAAATLGMLLSSPAGAGENKFQWTDPNSERVDRIKNLQSKIDSNDAIIGSLTKQITDNSTKIGELGSGKTPSPKGTQERGQIGLENANKTLSAQIDKINETQGQLRAQHKELIDAQNGERNTAMGEFRAKVAREMPFAERYPNAPMQMTLGAPVFSAITGAAAGRAARPFVGGKAGRYSTIGGAMIPGAVEGAGTQYYINEADVTGLPQGSPGQVRATENVTDPHWLTRLGLAALGSAAAGGLGAKWGLGTAGKAPALPRPMPGLSPEPPPAPRPQTPEPPPSPMPQAAAPPPAPQSPVDLTQFASDLERRGQIVSGGQTFKQASDGTWRNNGKFAKTPPEVLPLEASSDLGQTLRYWSTLPAPERAARMQQLFRDRPELRSILGDIGMK